MAPFPAAGLGSVFSATFTHSKKAKPCLPTIRRLGTHPTTITNADKVQSVAWVLVTPGNLGTVDIQQQLSETSGERGQEGQFHTGSFSQHFISQCASSKGSLEAVSEPSPIGVPFSRSCQRQANSLRRWLELSQEEPSCEDLHLEEQVKTELEEVSKVRPRSAQLPCPSHFSLPPSPGGTTDPAAG